MAYEEVERGKLWAGFKGLNDQDLKRILLKLNVSSRGRVRENRPRKCRRLQGVGEILSKLPPPVPLTYFNVVGNELIGNEGTKHLHLLPESVVDLDLSNCGITLEGVKNICSFLKTNKSITRFIMWDSSVGDEGAKHIGEMLKVNKTLRILCIMGCEIGPEGFCHLSDGLIHNDTLRELDVTRTAGDQHVRNLCPGLAQNRGLEVLEISSSSVTETGLKHLEEEVLQDKNMYLTSVKLNQPENDEHLIRHGPTFGLQCPWNRICYWLKFNKLNRKLIQQDNTKNATLSDWCDAVIASSEENFLDGVYFFLSNCPELCSRAHLEE